MTRFIAACLLPGYVWLIIGGGLWLIYGGQYVAGPIYDALLHTIFLGFVFSMIFGHAPVIIPAVLGVQVPYTPLLRRGPPPEAVAASQSRRAALQTEPHPACQSPTRQPNGRSQYPFTIYR